ncbi:MAG: YncE family protein, partial [Anaerolineales bacterium]
MSQRRIARRRGPHARLTDLVLLLVVAALLSACAGEKGVSGSGGTVTPVASSALAVPAPLAVNTGSNRIYVASESPDVISVIDGASNSVVGTLPAGLFPFAIDVDPSSNRIYVASRRSKLWVIDGTTNSVDASIALDHSPIALAVNPDAGRVYVADFEGT